LKLRVEEIYVRVSQIMLYIVRNDKFEKEKLEKIIKQKKTKQSITIKNQKGKIINCYKTPPLSGGASEVNKVRLLLDANSTSAAGCLTVLLSVISCGS